MANKQYRLTEAEWHFIQDMRSMEMDELLDIVIALRNEVRELEKKQKSSASGKRSTGWRNTRLRRSGSNICASSSRTCARHGHMTEQGAPFFHQCA